jgi:hypothetical protein
VTPPTTPLAKVWAYKSTGYVAGVAHLRVATEARGKYTSYVVTIKSVRGAIKTLRARVGTRGPIQEITWRIPPSAAPQTLRFCVAGHGPSSQVSTESCASLTIKRPRRR